MSRLLPRALLLLVLCCASCVGTETGNPDPSTPRDGGAHHGDAGVIPGIDSGSPSDAGVSPDASGQDGGATSDAGADDAGLDEDGGDGQDEDAGS